MKTPEGDAVSLGHDDIGEHPEPLAHIIPSKFRDPAKSPIGVQKTEIQRFNIPTVYAGVLIPLNMPGNKITGSAVYHPSRCFSSSA